MQHDGFGISRGAGRRDGADRFANEVIVRGARISANAEDASALQAPATECSKTRALGLHGWPFPGHVPAKHRALDSRTNRFVGVDRVKEVAITA